MTQDAPAHGHIIICRADQLLDKVKEHAPTAVLSIEHPDVQPGQDGYAPRLTDGTPQMILTFWDAEEPVAGGPDLEQVTKGIAFVMDHIKDGDVIIHCKGGASRSTAVALGVLSALNPRKDADYLVALLLDIRPIAAPNLVIVGLADALTGRGGTLLKAVKDSKQIAATRSLADIGRSRWLKKHPEAYQKMHPEKRPPPPASPPPAAAPPPKV